MHRLRLSFVDGDVRGVEVSALVRIANRIQTARQAGETACRLWENDRTAIVQSLHLNC